MKLAINGPGRVGLCAGLLFAFGAGGIEESQALTTYEAFARGKVVIMGYLSRDAGGTEIDLGDIKPSDLEVVGEGDVDIDDVFFEGNATADNTPQVLEFSDPLVAGASVEANATGSAAFPPTSFAFSEWGATAEMEFINHSTTLDYVVEFCFAWEYSVEATADNTATEHALAGIGIELNTYRDVRFIRNVFSDTDFGGGLFADSGVSPTWTIVIPKEGDDDIRLSVSVGGMASATAPEALTSGLFALALGALGVRLGCRRGVDRG